MATARKLPSGSWRCQVYDYTDGGGKRHYKSFTSNDPSPRGRREVEKLAAVYAANKENMSHIDCASNYTVKEALNAYCDLKDNVLSPSTVRGYRIMIRNSYSDIENVLLTRLTKVTVQRWINNLSKIKSPKTVSNVYGLFTAAVSMFAPDAFFKVKLPQKIIASNYVPSDGDIKKLIAYFAENNRDMLIAVYLAAFGTLRRSEICALTTEDVNGNVIRINKSVVDDAQNHFITKPTPKTLSSNRYIDMPEFVIKEFPTHGRLVNLSPQTISRRFRNAFEHLDIPRFRFHDLRHYSASIMHAIGVPDVYIMKRGGWQSDTTLKKIYRGSIEDYQKIFTESTLNHFETMQHEMQHEIK